MRILGVFILCFIFPFTGSAQIGGSLSELDFSYLSPKEYELGPIKIYGANNYDHQAIKLIAGLRQGLPITLPSEQINTAIKNLWKEGLFSDISIYAEKEISGIVYLIIELKPRPKLSRFKFTGVSKREADKIREEISLFSGKTITENLVFQTRNQIRGFFREKSFYNVKVNIDRIKDTVINNSELFVIDVEKGEKVGIKEIKINGVISVPMWKLKLAMKDTKQKSLLRIFKRSKFTQSSYVTDKEALLAKFNAVGLRDAEIAFDTVYQLDEKNLVIDLTINEGGKYYFGDISWTGNTKYRSSYLDTILGIKRGDLYNKSLLEQRIFGNGDGRDISSLYMDRGYLFFQVIPVETNVTDRHINYQVRMLEGKEARIGSVTIRGNTKTNDYVILREVRTKPGDLFNKADIMRTQRDLAQLGYFN
ncbi:MAG: outer membrane protein assembly factor BamA, partial [Crocinitomicaceae bacterium]|nr:outer membrane protein assembly factor BamA [Crocinitomicaceae bacterium]